MRLPSVDTHVDRARLSGIRRHVSGARLNAVAERKRQAAIFFMYKTFA